MEAISIVTFQSFEDSIVGLAPSFATCSSHLLLESLSVTVEPFLVEYILKFGLELLFNVWTIALITVVPWWSLRCVIVGSFRIISLVWNSILLVSGFVIGVCF